VPLSKQTAPKHVLNRQPPPQMCKSGQCVNKPTNQCMGSWGCKYNQICVMGRCVDRPEPGGCRTSADCGDGQVCKAGTCVDIPGR
jgi:peptidoglycan-associated lipoprotein